MILNLPELTKEEIWYLFAAYSVYLKKDHIMTCPRCSAKLKFSWDDSHSLSRCSAEGCISAKWWSTKLVIGPTDLPKFAAADLVIFMGEHHCPNEAVEVILGMVPGFSEYVELRPNAPQWAKNEYIALKRFYDGAANTCKDLNGNRYGIHNNRRRQLCDIF